MAQTGVGNRETGMKRSGIKRKKSLVRTVLAPRAGNCYQGSLLAQTGVGSRVARMKRSCTNASATIISVEAFW